MLTHLSLFSGIGGIDLAAEWAGFRTVAFVEKDPFCQKVLAKHWPEVPIYGDITEFGRHSLAHPPHVFSDGGNAQPERNLSEPGNDSCSVESIDLLSGGFPCQPFSVAGKRKGVGDERFLWDEMLRVIREVQPVWVLGENVRGLLSIDGGRTFGTILHELATVGYRVGWGVYGACHVGAPHRRERVFIVANRNGSDGGLQPERQPKCQEATEPRDDGSPQPLADPTRIQLRRQEQRPQWERIGPQGESEPLGHTKGGGRGERYSDTRGGRKGARTAQERPRPTHGSGWLPEPNVGRVANGVPRRVDRLRALGNAVVPQQVYPILQAIADQLRGVA